MASSCAAAAGRRGVAGLRVEAKAPPPIVHTRAHQAPCAHQSDREGAHYLLIVLSRPGGHGAVDLPPLYCSGRVLSLEPVLVGFVAE